VIYCSVTDVRNALAQGDDSGTNTAADMPDTIIEDAINEAGSVIDSYVGGPYADTDFVPGVITYWCRDMAAYLSTLTWRKSKDLTAQDPVVLRQAYVTQMLQDIRDDKLAIPSPGNGLGSGNGGPPQTGMVATVVNPFPPTSSPFPLFVEQDYDLYGRGIRLNRGGRFVTYWGGIPKDEQFPDAVPSDAGTRTTYQDPGPPGG
jgi:phage gp36-like protein